MPPTSLFHLPFSPLGTGSLAKHEVHLPQRSQTHRPMMDQANDIAHLVIHGNKFFLTLLKHSNLFKYYTLFI